MADDKGKLDGKSVPPEEKPQVPLARPLVYLGVVVGLLLAAAGLGMLVFRLGTASAAVLSTCVGFGIVLVAFGTQAGGKWSGFWATGCGAMAVGLYLLLHGMPIGEPQGYIKGAIEDSASYGMVRIVGSSDLLVGRAGPADYRFAAFDDDLNSDQAYVFATGGPPNHPENTYPPEFYIGCIPASLFRDRFGKVDEMMLSLQWDAAAKQFELVDLLDRKSYGVWSKKRCPRPDTEAKEQPGPLDQLGKFLGGLLGAPPTNAQEVLDSGGIAMWIRKLEATDPVVRDDARDALSQVTDPTDLKTISSMWDVANSSYRADLGRLVTWTDAVAMEPSASDAIIASMTPEQLTYAVSLAGHPDSTMQGWAKNFTSDMLSTADAEKQGVVMGKALELMKEGSDVQWPVATKGGIGEDFVVNTLSAFNIAKCSLAPENRIVLTDGIKDLNYSELGTNVGALAADVQNYESCT